MPQPHLNTHIPETESGWDLTASARNLTELAHRSPPAAERQFRAMGKKKQLALIRSVGAEQKRDLLYLASDAAPLVRAMEPTELYLLTAEMGRWESGQFVVAASADQIHAILGLDAFRNGRFDFDQALDWMELMLDADEPRLAKLLPKLDPDLLTALFDHYRKNRRAVGVMVQDRLLQCYPGLIEFRQQTVQQLFELLYEQDPELFERIFRRLALKNRRRMNADLGQAMRKQLEKIGLPTIEEARTIYLEPRKDAPQLTPRKHPPRSAFDSRSPEPDHTLPELFSSGRGFFARAVHFAEENGWMCEDSQGRLHRQGLELMDKFFVAEGLSLSDAQHLSDRMRVLPGVLNIGLEQLSMGSEAMAAKIVSQAPLLALFQHGFKRLRALRRQGAALWLDRRLVRLRSRLISLDPPYELMVRLARKRIPMLYDPAEKNARYPTSLHEIKNLENTLAGIRRMINNLFAFCPGLPVSLAHIDVTRIPGLETADIQLSTVLNTLALIGKLKSGPRWAPIEADRLVPLIGNRIRKSNRRTLEKLTAQLQLGLDRMTELWTSDEACDLLHSYMGGHLADLAEQLIAASDVIRTEQQPLVTLLYTNQVHVNALILDDSSPPQAGPISAGMKKH